MYFKYFSLFPQQLGSQLREIGGLNVKHGEKELLTRVKPWWSCLKGERPCKQQRVSSSVYTARVSPPSLHTTVVFCFVSEAGFCCVSQRGLELFTFWADLKFSVSCVYLLCEKDHTQTQCKEGPTVKTQLHYQGSRAHSVYFNLVIKFLFSSFPWDFLILGIENMPLTGSWQWSYFIHGSFTNMVRSSLIFL